MLVELRCAGRRGRHFVELHRSAYQLEGGAFLRLRGDHVAVGANLGIRRHLERVLDRRPLSLERAETRAREGDWEGYGAALDELRTLLEQLQGGGR